jgi:DNA-binding SARP family transcriptional activator
MNTTDSSLEVRVLGQFSILLSGRPLTTPWPSPGAKELFLNLLSPQGDPVSRDRLCRALSMAPASDRTKSRLAELIVQLNTYFLSECRVKPVIEIGGGLTLHEALVRLDARSFWQVSQQGLQLLAAGESMAAVKSFKTALALYGGEYLPGADSRIISLHRDCLRSQYLALERYIAKQPTGSAGPAARVCPEALAA